MNKIRFTINAVATLIFTLACASLAQAQATRTWVSGVGNDADPCSRTAPCKTFAGAILKTAEGGEISVVDPGGYGAVTITKSITIDGGTGAGWASILVAKDSTGIIVNVTDNPSTSVVTLRNLSINGARNCTADTCKGAYGIRFLAGQTLHVQNVNIFGFTQNGIDATLAADGSNLTVQDSTIRECDASGVSITTSKGAVAAVLTNVHIDKCESAVSAADGSVVTIRNSTLALSGNGVNTGKNSNTNIDDSLFPNNGTGVNVASGATVRLGGNTFANNLTGVANGGIVESDSKNKFMGNLTATSGNAFGSFIVQ
jgi:hypothetical protein